jgi:hypothetical protein
MFISCDDGAEDNSESSNNSVDGEKEQGLDEDHRSNSGESSENEEQAVQGKLEFPDTEIKIEHVKGHQ